ncbi:MAG: organic solvent ABC transporter substrate-binding protein [Flavobacterium sp. BFFFF1]|uniref:MlaD family protein n=1 Tax=Flavobacterium sp. BFFFF1 TaxID=2015557 RepID=UPI000BD812FC|nr:MlaD family protein [Flavobacterium sp. BFFFF1]OYU79751.1 MAG: organic solvent ABC transporter substrate-binding protein [Flavobacterium sp. BFFFF1]
MKKKSSNYTWKLGMFVIMGLAAFFITIYFIGKSQNLFGSTFYLKSQFKNVSGLKVGNNVLLSGIDIGTVKDIQFVSDSAVVVGMTIRSEIQQYIKSDAMTSIGSDGLMGDKVVTISPGSASDKMIQDHATIASVEAIEIQDLMSGLKKSVDNAEIITKQLSEFSYKINNGKGALSKVLTDAEFAKSIDKTMTNLETGTDEFVAFTKKLNDKNGTFSKLMTDPSYANSIKKTLSGFEKSAADINVFTASLNNGKGIVSRLFTDETWATSLDSTMINLQTGTKKLNELEEAAKHNFLLRGYFRKQEKAKAKKKAELGKANR